MPPDPALDKTYRDGRNVHVPTSAALPGDLLVSRLHVDLLRVTTTACCSR